MKHPSVIVVTHDLLLREALFEHFFRAGWKVTDEATVGDVPRRMLKAKPHVIIIDDRQDGVISALKSWSLQPLMREIPILVLTSRMHTAQVEEYLDAGASTVVPLSMYHPQTVVKLSGKII